MGDYNDLLMKYEELKQEYEEFQKSSHEYERELELQGDQLEKKVSSLQVARQRLENDLENLKQRHGEQQDSMRRQIVSLQDDLGRARGEINEKNEYIRKLELTNDDLERAKRALETNCDDLERQLETALEQNAFLQGELDERESVCLLIQHLREELRDVQRENEILRLRSSDYRTSIPESVNASQSEFADKSLENIASDDSKQQANGSKSCSIAIASTQRQVSLDDSEYCSTRTPLSWSERRSILDADSDVHRVALSVVGAHAVAAAFQPVGNQLDGSKPLSLPSAVASAQTVLNSASGALSPAVRIEALAIVNELVHRVGVLEAAVRKQLDPAAQQPNARSASSINAQKRFCLNLGSGWKSPPVSTRTRFDFVSPFGTVRNRNRANSASPCSCSSNGVGVNLAAASVLMSPFATPTSNRVVETSVPN